MRKILQVIPAQGVIAVFDEGGSKSRYPVVCWALVEDSNPDDVEFGGPMQDVVGMTLLDGSPRLTEVDSGDSQGAFVGYEYAH